MAANNNTSVMMIAIEDSFEDDVSVDDSLSWEVVDPSDSDFDKFSYDSSIDDNDDVDVELEEGIKDEEVVSAVGSPGSDVSMEEQIDLHRLIVVRPEASYRKIHPSPCLIEPIDGGINDIKAADGNTQGSSGIELMLEPNPEKDIIGPSGIELLVEPNRSSGVESLLGPNPKELSGPSGIEMLVESNPEKQFTGSSGIELLLQPNLEKKFTGRSRIELMLEPNPEKEFAGTSGIELLREPNPEKEFTFRDLQMLTNNFAGEFSNNNFGKLYLGRIPDGWKGMEAQDVTIKIWNHDMGYRPFWDNDALNRMATEVNILSQPEMESHPNMATVEGYCFEEMNLGVVYSIEPKRTLRSVVDYGPFTWARRVKLALGLARLLQFLHMHQPQFLVRNLAASHIMLDKDWKPILVDYSMLVGGGFGDTRKAGRGGPLGTDGYRDPFLCDSAEWTERSDVFAYGIILLELLFKRRFDAKVFQGCSLDNVGRGIYRKFESMSGESKSSFTILTNFGEDHTFVFGDGVILSKLAVQCVEYRRDSRPTMTEVIEELEKLQVLKKLQ